MNAKGKDVANYTQTQLKTGIRTFYTLQKKREIHVKSAKL